MRCSNRASEKSFGPRYHTKTFSNISFQCVVLTVLSFIPTDEIAGNKSKEECGSCYGAETKKMACCNSCADVELAYRNRGWVLVHDQVTVCRQEGLIKNFSNEEVASEGCRIHGFMIVNKASVSFFLVFLKLVWYSYWFYAAMYKI